MDAFVLHVETVDVVSCTVTAKATKEMNKTRPIRPLDIIFNVPTLEVSGLSAKALNNPTRAAEQDMERPNRDELK